MPDPAFVCLLSSTQGKDPDRLTSAEKCPFRLHTTTYPKVLPIASAASYFVYTAQQLPALERYPHPREKM
jgi:hypothetical protein